MKQNNRAGIQNFDVLNAHESYLKMAEIVKRARHDGYFNSVKRSKHDSLKLTVGSYLARRHYSVSKNFFDEIIIKNVANLTLLSCIYLWVYSVFKECLLIITCFFRKMIFVKKQLLVKK